jgi:hypothetical protein
MGLPVVKVKDKAIPLQSTGPEGSRRFPDFKKIST